MGKKKGKKAKLLPHEEDLLLSGSLTEVTHEGATSRWLVAPSTPPGDVPPGHVLVYRPVGDAEAAHLLLTGSLPGTQPYQAIIEGEGGRTYAEKFLRGIKKVDTRPTTVVEFSIPRGTYDALYAKQHKVEDGAISVGLGDKAGGGLDAFNEALQCPPAGFRIVLVKRRAAER